MLLNSERGRIQGGAKISHVGSLIQKNFFFRPEGFSKKKIECIAMIYKHVGRSAVIFNSIPKSFLGAFKCLFGLCHFGLLLIYRLEGGLLDYSTLVCPSVRHTSVFRTFLFSLLRYWLCVSYRNLSWRDTDQVWFFSRFTYCYKSYCPSLKFSFPCFPHQTFEILPWHLVYEFVYTSYRSS